MTFSQLLGRSFSALRHNPAVLFGFAVVVQLVITLVSTGVMTLVLLATVSRLETLTPSSPDFEAVVAGTVATNLGVGFAVALVGLALTAIVQAVVAADIGAAAVGDRARLSALWHRIRPVLWRVFGFAALAAAAMLVFLLLLVALVFAGILVGPAGAAVAIGITLLMILGSIPLWVWLAIRLLLVPSVLVLEHTTFRQALVRSWHLTQGRFWVAFGVMALIALIMGTAAQIVATPGALLSTVIGGIIAPTGEPTGQEIATLILALVLPQILVLVIQAISVVVQSTGAALIYLDCRMRHEGLDHDLMAARERRAQGLPLERDPFLVDTSPRPFSQPPASGFSFASAPPPATPATAPAPAEPRRESPESDHGGSTWTPPGSS